ncbi:MAG: riboflavin synthase [Sarcina sp.]
MFTGIVEEIGEIISIEMNGKSASVSILAKIVLNDSKVGDSIAINGVCLTVTNIKKDSFQADVMNETINRTNFSCLKVGSKVNLERAMTVNGRFGGHIVSGHIDGIGSIESYVKDDNATWITIKADKNILKYIIEKGSICIDGVSLTVAYVDDKSFKVCIIPHTTKETTLLKHKIKENVNLECDIVGKYIEKFSQMRCSYSRKSNISEEFLKSNGFM